MTIAEKIKLTLDRNNSTIRELAIKSGIPEQSLRSMLKRNDYKISILGQIAKGLDISFYELVQEELAFEDVITWPTKEISKEDAAYRQEREETQKLIARLEEQLDDKRQIIELMKKQLADNQ